MSIKDLLDSVGSTGGFDDFVSSVTPDIPNVELLIEELIHDQGSEYGGIKMDGFHASAVATRTCPHFYALSKQFPDEQVFNAQQKMIFSNGHAVHDRLQRILSSVLYGSWRCKNCGVYHEMNKAYVDWLDENKDGVEFEKELEQIGTFTDIPKPMPKKCISCGSDKFHYAEWRVISHEYGFSSKMDGIFMNGQGKFVGWEIKSANSRMFSLFQQNGPSKKYLHQFGLYMRLENMRLGDGHFENGVMTFENKNDQTRKHFPVFMADVDVLPELKAAKKAMKMIRDGVDLSKGKLNSECKTCEFFNKRCFPK